MFQKYAAALISILLVAFAFLKTALADYLDAAEVWQLVALVAGAIAVFLLPLAKGKWAGVLKTGSAVVVALATALVPFGLQGTITPEQWTIVALAVLNALGVQVGVDARKSSLIAATSEPVVVQQSAGEFSQTLAHTPTAIDIDPEGARHVLRP